MNRQRKYAPSSGSWWSITKPTGVSSACTARNHALGSKWACAIETAFGAT